MNSIQKDITDQDAKKRLTRTGNAIGVVLIVALGASTCELINAVKNKDKDNMNLDRMTQC